MPTKRLYLQPIPDGAQIEDQATQRANLSEQGLLGGGSNVEQISQQPGDATLRGQYRCRSADYAEMMARELRELGNADGFDAVPFYRADTESPDDGYYVIEAVLDVGPVRPQEPSVQQFRLSLSEDGTHETRWLAVETSQAQVDNPFGNDTTPRIAVPAVAGKRRWYDDITGAVAAVGSPLETRSTEHGDVDIYDVDSGEAAVGTSNADRGPTLLYELSYSEEGVVDPVVWDSGGISYGDTYGKDYASIAPKMDGGLRQWQHVFTSSHEFRGAPVLDSGLLRVFVNEAGGDLEAETWNDSTSEWDTVGLDWSGTDWALFDWDVERITPASIESQATFEHPTDGFFVLDAVLDRGAELVRWSNPRASEQGAIPSGLETVLDPTASAEVVDPQPVRELVQRSEVRR